MFNVSEAPCHRDPMGRVVVDVRAVRWDVRCFWTCARTCADVRGTCAEIRRARTCADVRWTCAVFGRALDVRGRALTFWPCAETCAENLWDVRGRAQTCAGRALKIAGGAGALFEGEGFWHRGSKISPGWQIFGTKSTESRAHVRRTSSAHVRALELRGRARDVR